MNTKLILDYLKDLEQNNNQEWYHAHKAEYQQAYDEFLKVIEALMMELGKIDPAILEYEPKQLTFKLIRDTRFSKDNSPYNPSFRAHISSKGKMPVPVGWFLVLKPSGSFLGGGLFADMFKDATESVRTYIADHGEEWEKIIENPAFKEKFRVKGNALKNVPRGYDASHPQAEYLKYKSWYLEYFMQDDQLLDSESFIKESLDICMLMKPFNDFLNKALADFQMPVRP